MTRQDFLGSTLFKKIIFKLMGSFYHKLIFYLHILLYTLYSYFYYKDIELILKDEHCNDKLHFII